MPTSSEASSHTLFAGLTAEELIAAEQEHELDPDLLATPSVLGKRTSPSGEGDSDDDTDRPLSPDIENHSSLDAHAGTSTLRMKQAVQRLKKRLKLSSEDTVLLEQFVQVCVLTLPSPANS